MKQLLWKLYDLSTGLLLYLVTQVVRLISRRGK